MSFCSKLLFICVQCLMIFILLGSDKNIVLTQNLSEKNVTAAYPSSNYAINASKKLQTSENVYIKIQPKQTKNPYEFTNKIAINYIWPTFPIGFLILGTIGNILSIIVVSLA
jgi:hypothetical protein